MTRRREAIRRRIIRAMSRDVLEEVSELDAPWDATRAALEADALAAWNDDLRDEFLDWLRKNS